MTVAGHTFELQVADPPVGILFLLAMSSISVYGVMLAGWSSGSKYPLLGSVRASAQMISYEAALGMTVVMVVLHWPGSLSTRAIVDSQSHTFFASWNLIRTGIVPFIIFMIAITAELSDRPSTWSKPTASSSAASTPSTPRSASPCSSWPSS